MCISGTRVTGSGHSIVKMVTHASCTEVCCYRLLFFNSYESYSIIINSGSCKEHSNFE